jgi:hypothetical protein
MATLFSRLFNGSPAGMDKAVVGEKEDEGDEKQTVNVMVSIFFDGTLNNRANTRIRLATQKELEEKLAQATAETEQVLAEDTAADRAQKLAEQDVDAANLAHVRAAKGDPRAAAKQALKAAEAAAKAARQRRRQAAEALDGAQKRQAAAKRTRDKYRDAVNGKSGANYFSNVSILQEMNLIEDPALEVAVYVEGIGTDDGEDDCTLGSGFGAGPTGIAAKVSRAILLIKEAITTALGKEKQLGTLRVDVFGFSRGAAAARHFVSLLRTERPLAARLGAPRAKVVIKFVGVFDTVSSYGVGLSFGSSVAELGLALGGVPQKVVHLTAGDECRENFSLTDISSSLGSGYELTLPGVHSDVGGGYGEVEDETRTFSTGERARLLGQGWYTPAQLRASTLVLPVTSPYVSPATVPCLVGTRRALRWHYQFIPLRIMATHARKHGVSWQPLRPGSRFEFFDFHPTK